MSSNTLKSRFVMIAKSLSESTASLYSTPLGMLSLTGTRQICGRLWKEYTQIEFLLRRKARVHSGEKPADLYSPFSSLIEKTCASFDIAKGSKGPSIQSCGDMLTRVSLSNESRLV